MVAKHESVGEELTNFFKYGGRAYIDKAKLAVGKVNNEGKQQYRSKCTHGFDSQ